MSSKINEKMQIITNGSSTRVVLDYDSCLVYNYHDASQVLAVFDSGRWIMNERPYHRTSGWGRPSQGDSYGSGLHYKTKELLQNIGATIYQTNQSHFDTLAGYKALFKKAKQIEKLAKNANELGLDFEAKKEAFKLRLENRGNGKGLDAFKTIKKMRDALEVFFNQKGRAVKVDDYLIDKNTVKQKNNVVAFRDAQGKIFLNSQVLSVSNFERNILGNQSIIQKAIREKSDYAIPFNVLASANLKLEETKIIEQGPESEHQILKDSYSGRTEIRHFTGALLLENNGRKFLMDIDRREIEHKIFNAFFVEVNSSVNSIAEAYNSMMPDEVKQAEKQGLKVLRQGEWFFIPTDKTVTVSESQVLNWKRDNSPSQIILAQAVSHGKGRPNNLFKPVGFGELDQYVCGQVTHQGREHAPLDLKVETVKGKDNGDDTLTYHLYKLVPNTTVGNFTINGDID